MTDAVAVVSRYYDAKNPYYRGNAFIELYHQDMAEAFDRVLHSPIAYRKEDREAEADTRRGIVITKYMQFYWGLPHLVAAARSIFEIVCAGYALRQPKETPTEGLDGLNGFVDSGAAMRDHPSPVVPWSAIWIGTPGCCKSSLIQRWIHELCPRLFHHAKHGMVYQLVAVYSVCPSGADSQALLQNVYLQLREASRSTGAPHPFANGPIPSKTPQLLEAIGELAKQLNLGLLVLDELQHLFQGTNLKLDDSLRSLTTLMAKLSIPTLLIGTWDALSGLASAARLARRSISPGTTFFRRLPFGEDFDDILEGLWRLNYANQASLDTPGLREAIYLHTQGIPDLIVKLCGVAQLRSITTGELIDEKMINSLAAEWSPILSMVLKQLRLGKDEADIRIWDLEPLNLEAYLKEYADRMLRLRPPRSKAVRQREMAAQKEAETALAKALQPGAGKASPPAAEKAPTAEAQGVNDPLAPPELTIGPMPPKKSKNLTAKEEAQYDKEFAALPDDDLRKLFYLAGKTGTPMVTMLKEHGYVLELFGS